MAEQNRDNTPSPKPKRSNAYDEPFGNQKTYDHVTMRDTDPPVREDAYTEERRAPATEEYDAPTPPKKSSAKKVPPQKKKTAGRESERKTADTRNRSSSRKEVTLTKRKDKPARDSGLPRSAMLFHRVMPYVLIGFGAFIALALILNLFCNWQNGLERPGEHWMGIVGYGVCYALFGLLGPAAFAIPLTLLNLGIYWKRYIDRKLIISKIIASAIFVVVLAAVIHIFCLIGLDPTERDLSVKMLIEAGVKITGGGLIGGKLGFLMYSFCHFVGALIVGFLLLTASLFYFLGMAPHHLWNYLRNRRKLRARRKISYSEQNAADAENRAKMKEKIHRTTTGQVGMDDMDDLDEEAPEGAVRVMKNTGNAKKAPADKMAPMPKPRLAPTDGDDLYIPDSINAQMAAMDEEEHLAAELAIRQEVRAAVNARAASMRPQPARPTVPPEPSFPPKPIDPASNRDAAVEPIFPKTAENRQPRRIPRADRNFDLKSIFIDLDDADDRAQRHHAPLPPEVPLTGNGKKTVTGTPTPAKATAERPTPAQGTRPITVTGTLRTPITTAKPTGEAVRPSPAAATAKPATPAVKSSLPKTPDNTAKPGFEQVKPQKQDFGLTNEEFEKLEAQHIDLTRAKKTATGEKAAPASDTKKTAPAAKASKPAPKAASKRYTFPPISYLHPGEPMTEENRAELEASMNALATTLKSFHVGIEDNIRYSCGPTVTRYEITPAAGVRVRTITNLADDIALALRSSGGIRIEAPIPGTNAVGIEVPNRTRSTIYLRELIESKVFSESKNKLTACLGAGIAGEPLIFDIAKMPHLLIAGTTGSGKSVCINCIVMSLLYKVTPDEVKLVMIDPKKVEFSIYKNIPHLMAPVVTTPKDAAGALQASVEEMERRFELFEQVGVRDLKGYNAATADDPDMPALPHIVIIIDELADLMMTARDEVETAICRIAQKARAAGMHLIIGTQRPSADVVTGLIKSNVPSRIAFAVKSQVDSRVILDHIGAESLTGRGDMLFVPIGSMRDTRVQGAFVDDKEVEKICEFIRATNGTAVYDEKFIAKLKELAAQCGNKGRSGGDMIPPSEDGGEKISDSKYADAVRIAIEEKRISTSLLQRKLEIGYSRAAKLLDRMQSEGLISPPDGSKPRTILITPEEYLEKFVDNPDAGAE